MNLVETIILGIVEGITEFLPISSTAHLEITHFLLGIQTTDFVKSFEIAIQLGAILAVLFLYSKKIFTSYAYIKNILIAFIPTAVIGFALYRIIKYFLLGNVDLAAVMLILGGIIIILYEKKEAKRLEKVSSEKTIENLSVKELLIIGFVQALAVVPGVSRSGAVIIGGRMLGLPKLVITEFSFLLAIPTMIAATGYDLLKSGFSFTANEWGTIGIGFVVAFVTALFVVKWLLTYVRSHSFEVFGWYRIAVGFVVLSILAFF